MSDRRSVPVQIRGKQFRIRSDEDPEALQRIAEYVDATMERVESRTAKETIVMTRKVNAKPA